MNYDKPHLSFEDQLNLLEHRGLIVDSREDAVRNLSVIGYYRLSAYWYQWRVRPEGHVEHIDIPFDAFEGGHSFEEAVDLYSFDRQLRLIILDAIERIEVAVRVQMAYIVGRRNPTAHTDPSCLGSKGCKLRPNSQQTYFEEFRDRCVAQLEKSSEVFANHYRLRYEQVVPIWVAVELWDFGTMSMFCQLMMTDDRMELAAAFELPEHKMMANWLVVINHLRNMCAHHSRLFRRRSQFEIGTKSLWKIRELAHVRNIPSDRQRNIYPALCALTYLMRTAAPYSDWIVRLGGHLDSFPTIQDTSLEDYGFPPEWRSELIWN